MPLHLLRVAEEDTRLRSIRLQPVAEVELAEVGLADVELTFMTTHHRTQMKKFDIIMFVFTYFFFFVPPFLFFFSPPGLHTTAREPQRAHLRVPVFKNNTKIPREDSQEREERKKIVVAGEGNKSAKFRGPSPFGVPYPSGGGFKAVPRAPPPVDPGTPPGKPQGRGGRGGRESANPIEPRVHQKKHGLGCLSRRCLCLLVCFFFAFFFSS